MCTTPNFNLKRLVIRMLLSCEDEEHQDMAEVKHCLVHTPMVLISSLPGPTACKLKGSSSFFTAKTLQQRRVGYAFCISVFALALQTSVFIHTASIFLNAPQQEVHLGHVAVQDPPTIKIPLCAGLLARIWSSSCFKF